MHLRSEVAGHRELVECVRRYVAVGVPNGGVPIVAGEERSPEVGGSLAGAVAGTAACVGGGVTPCSRWSRAREGVARPVRPAGYHPVAAGQCPVAQGEPCCIAGVRRADLEPGEGWVTCVAQQEVGEHGRSRLGQPAVGRVVGSESVPVVATAGVRPWHGCSVRGTGGEGAARRQCRDGTSRCGGQDWWAKGVVRTA